MLKRHFAHEEYYLQLVELFHDVTYRTEMGQLLDLTSQPMDAPSDLTRRVLYSGAPTLAVGWVLTLRASVLSLVGR